MIGPKEKKERSLGVRLHLKGERCSTPKCAMVRKPYKPGAHGQSRRRKMLSEFGTQLKEKQKFKLSYGLDERNLKHVFFIAKKARGSSAAKMIEFLEWRLDNVFYRLGFAPSRGAARQLVVHGHIAVNGKRARSPGFFVKPGDAISAASGVGAIEKRRELIKKYEPPEWLVLDKDKLEGRVLSPPQGVEMPFEANVLVESFSK